MKLKTILNIPDYRYNAGTILRWLWQTSRGNRLQAGINAALGLADVVISLAQVWAVQNAIDVASHATAGSLYWAVGYMGLLILCSFAISISSVWVRNILGVKAQNKMQQQMLNRILHSEWQGKERLHSGDVINRLEKDVNSVVVFITETIPGTLSVLMLFIGAFCYLFSMDKLLALIIIIMLPLFIIVSKLYVGKMRQLTRQVRNSDSRVQSVLQETIQNRMVIKTLESDDMMVDKLENTQSELRQHVVRRTRFSVFSNLILNAGFSLGYLIAFLWSATRMYNHTLSFGGMTAFLQLVNRIQGPARSLTRLVPAFVGVFTAAERLMELEENPLEEQGEPIRMKGPCGIRLENVSYMYNEQEGLVLDNLSYDFRPGSCTAVLGETGAGKTTIVRMILSLIRPIAGRAIIYNKVEERQLSSRLRCNLVYVPQGNTLLSGTIRENLRLGKVTATDEEMWEVLRMACADFVEELPEQLDTKCAEEGVGLSEGQAQRIAIARALLRDGDILIFDESTSALDPETERQLLQQIIGNHNKTIIFITHRPAVKEYCDQTLTIERL